MWKKSSLAGRGWRQKRAEAEGGPGLQEELPELEDPEGQHPNASSCGEAAKWSSRTAFRDDRLSVPLPSLLERDGPCHGRVPIQMVSATTHRVPIKPGDGTVHYTQGRARKGVRGCKDGLCVQATTSHVAWGKIHVSPCLSFPTY